MKLDDTIVFDVWGKYAHFKKIYITTSALSYGIPFKTSIYGLIGAIIGLENGNNDYLNYFNHENCKIAIQIINPIKFQRLNINMSDKPGPITGNRKPTMIEYVKNPHYQMFFWHADSDLRNTLLKHLKNKTSVYTPVLGLAHCITNFKLIDCVSFEENSGEALINTIIPKSQLVGFNQEYWIENEVHIHEQGMYPIELNDKREVTKRENVLFDLNGKPVKANVTSFFQSKVKEIPINAMFL